MMKQDWNGCNTVVDISTLGVYHMSSQHISLIEQVKILWVMNLVAGGANTEGAVKKMCLETQYRVK